jgi:hypothetical protein
VNKLGLQVMSTVLLPLVCGSCATQSSILYGSKIELEAGSDRGNGSKAKVDEVGFSSRAASAGSSLARRTAPRTPRQALDRPPGILELATQR